MKRTFFTGIGIVLVFLVSGSIAQSRRQWQSGQTDRSQAVVQPVTTPSSSSQPMQRYDLNAGQTGAMTSVPSNTSTQGMQNRQWSSGPQPAGIPQQPAVQYQQPYYQQPPSQWEPPVETVEPLDPLLDQVMELRLSGVYASVSGDLYDSAMGLESQLIYWAYSNLGLGLTVGYQMRDLKQQSWVVDSIPQSYTAYLQGTGDGTVIPVGLSVLLKLSPSRHLQVNLEGGLRYMMTNLDMSFNLFTDWVENTDTNETLNGTISADSGIVGRLGATFLYRFDDFIAMFFGFGYNLGISSGDVTMSASEEGEEPVTFTLENDLGGYDLQFGISIGTY